MNRHWLACRRNARPTSLVDLWCAARPSPTGVIHVVSLRRTQHVEAAKFIKRHDVLSCQRRNAILREQFGNRAGLAFSGRAVVAPNIEDKRVVELAFVLDSSRRGRRDSPHARQIPHRLPSNGAEKVFDLQELNPHEAMVSGRGVS